MRNDPPRTIYLVAAATILTVGALAAIFLAGPPRPLAHEQIPAALRHCGLHVHDASPRVYFVSDIPRSPGELNSLLPGRDVWNGVCRVERIDPEMSNPREVASGQEGSVVVGDSVLVGDPRLVKLVGDLLLGR